VIFQPIFSFFQEKNCHLFFKANHLKAVICRFCYVQFGVKDFNVILDVELFANVYSREGTYVCLQVITNTFPFLMPC